MPRNRMIEDNYDDLAIEKDPERGNEIRLERRPPPERVPTRTYVIFFF